MDRSIRMDERTDALVTDLAYFLRSSKKSVLHDAVAEFAETHHPRLLGKPGGLRKIGATDGELAEMERPSGEGELGLAVHGGLAGGGGVSGSRGIAGGGGVGASRGIAGGDDLEGGDGLEGARDRGETFEMLDPFERLALRRRELLRQFAELGGTNVRLLDRDETSMHDAGVDERIVLLAETDPIDGSAAVPALEEVARRVLGVHATVVSLTALRLFGSSGREERAVAQSRPL